jgi:hypothetical protein
MFRSVIACLHATGSREFLTAAVAASLVLLSCLLHAVVDGLPVVPEAKHDKLAGVLNKIYSQIGHVREGELGLQLP